MSLHGTYSPPCEVTAELVPCVALLSIRGLHTPYVVVILCPLKNSRETHDFQKKSGNRKPGEGTHRHQRRAMICRSPPFGSLGQSAHNLTRFSSFLFFSITYVHVFFFFLCFFSNVMQHLGDMALGLFSASAQLQDEIGATLDASCHCGQVS